MISLVTLLLSLIAGASESDEVLKRSRALENLLGIGVIFYKGMPLTGFMGMDYGKSLIEFGDGSRILLLVNDVDFLAAGASLDLESIGGTRRHWRWGQGNGPPACDSRLWNRFKSNSIAVFVYVDLNGMPITSFWLRMWGSFQYDTRFSVNNTGKAGFFDPPVDSDLIRARVLAFFLDFESNMIEGPSQIAAAVFDEAPAGYTWGMMTKQLEHYSNSVREYGRDLMSVRWYEEKGKDGYDPDDVYHTDYEYSIERIVRAKESFLEGASTFARQLSFFGIFPVGPEKGRFDYPIVQSQPATAFWELTYPKTAEFLLGVPSHRLCLVFRECDLAWLEKNLIQDISRPNVHYDEPLIYWRLETMSGTLLGEAPFEVGPADLLDLLEVSDQVDEREQSLLDDCDAARSSVKRRWLMSLRTALGR